MRKGPLEVESAPRRSRSKSQSQITQDVITRKSTIGERFKGYFKKIDQFGQEIYFTWNGEQKFKTTQGAIVSTILIIVILVYAGYGLK